MKLYLVQHAEALSKNEDPKRPLSTNGIFNIKKICEYSSNVLKIKINVIFHSTKQRAIESANFFYKYHHPPEGMIQINGLNPNDSYEIIFNRIKSLNKDIMIVGHLPHLERLSSFLLCNDENQRIVSLKNCSILCIDKNKEGSYSIDYLVLPEFI